MNKLHKSAIAVLATIVMGLSLFTSGVAQATPGALTMSLNLPSNWHFGDPEQQVTYSGSGELLDAEDEVSYGIEITYPGTCGAIVGDDPFYAGVYTVTPYAEVTVDDVSAELISGQSYAGYTFTAPAQTFTILPFDAEVTFNSGDNFSVYEGQSINTSLYSVATLPYGNSATSVTFLYSGGGLDGFVTTQPTTAGSYTITPQVQFSPDANCNFNATGAGRLIVSPWPVDPSPSATPTPPATPTPVVTPTPTATPLKKATITVTGGTYSYDGSPKSATVTTDPVGLSYSVKYSGKSNAPVDSGTHGVVATVTDSGYEATTASTTIVINKINPVLKWPTPAPIKSGTKLSDIQLNAQSDVKGTFTYTANKGDVLAPGTYDAIASFVPNDTLNYNTGRVSSVIQVKRADRQIVVTFGLDSSKIPGGALSTIRTNAALPGEKIVVYGYVQPSNSLPADKLLAQQRADALKAEILKLVPTANVVAIGKGRTFQPLCVSAKNKCAVVNFSS